MSKSAHVHIPRKHQAAPTSTTLRPDDGVVSNFDNAGTRLEKAESWIARNIGNALEKAYPDRDWRITVDAINGIVMIQAPLIEAEKGYFMHMKGKTIHDLEQQAVKAAGEVLERFNLTRNKKWNPEHLEDLARDTRGNAIGPDSNAESITGSGKTLKPWER